MEWKVFPWLQSKILSCDQTKRSKKQEMTYLFKNIEEKWQQRWEESQCFEVKMDKSKPKFYALGMFPYPSGAGLHMGHLASYMPVEVLCRYKKAKGFNVLHPIGYDAFGLPAEQYAIKTGLHPEKITQKAIQNFKRQLKSFGFSFDWKREISTCDPGFYKWTQFLFLQFFKKELVYRKEATVNWCPALRTVLANEEVIDGKSERGGHPVFRKPMKQWMLKITDYAEPLLEALEKLDWPERTKQGQKNWIGKSEGMIISFPLVREESFKHSKQKTVSKKAKTLSIFTTRSDTLFGVSFMVLSPEHPLVLQITSEDRGKEVQDYRKKSAQKSAVEREIKKKMSGVFTGAYALHPLNGKKLPIWVSDYVLLEYGTGVIMGTPAHDERDFEFASLFHLPILSVIEGRGELPFLGDGPHIQSEFLNGLTTKAALLKMSTYLEKKGLGKRCVQYKLRDWLFSRQRYWGEPFPLVYFPTSSVSLPPVNQISKSSSDKSTLSKKASLISSKNQAVSKENKEGQNKKEENVEISPVSVEELPVLLPSKISHFLPSEDSKPPLARLPEFVDYLSPEGKKGRREVDTMPGSAASSWYFLRYLDPKNNKEPFGFETQKYWMPVDLYVGGAEHTVGHLLYARFWQRVLYDLGFVSHQEPFKKLVHQGSILATDGRRMSKSRGNTVNPDQLREKYGSDALRLFICFLGPVEKDKPWQENGIEGVRRFLERVWRLCLNEKEECLLEGNPKQVLSDLEPKFKEWAHKTIKKVSEDIELLHLNTAISAMMELVNELYRLKKAPRALIKVLLQLLSPFAPHITEELWERIGEKSILSLKSWPIYDPQWIKENKVQIGVQVNGRLRGLLTVTKDTEEKEASQKAQALPNVKEALKGLKIVKVIYKKQRILNFIVLKSKK